ncbi:MAG TPA: hypothetical protein VF006_32655 [Longimicrobium sp.]
MHRFTATIQPNSIDRMSSIVRNTLRAGCLAAGVALLAPDGAAQTEVRVMAHGGLLPFTTVYGGGQVQVTPGAGGTSFYAEYNQWAWGIICESALDPGSPDEFVGDDRCSETGYTVHGGFTRHLRGSGASWRPYVSAGAGVARVLDRTEADRPVRPSLAVEGGYDVGGAGSFTLRLGARWQGRPQVGTDYVGPVIGLRLRL